MRPTQPSVPLRCGQRGRRCLGVSATSCRPQPCPSLRGTGYPPVHPAGPLSRPLDGCRGHPGGSITSPPPCSRICALLSTPVSPRPHWLPDPTHWLGDGLQTMVTHDGSPGGSQPRRQSPWRARETYGKMCINRGLKFNRFLRAGPGWVAIRQHNVQLFSLNTGSAPLPPAAPSTRDAQEHALWIRAGQSLGPPRSPARPRALRALWINFPSQLHPGPGDRLPLPSSPNVFGLPPTPETLIFLPTEAARRAAGYGSFHFIPRQLHGSAPARCSSSRSPPAHRTPVLRHSGDGDLGALGLPVSVHQGFPLG